MTDDETPDGSGPRASTRVWPSCVILALLIAVAFTVVAPPERCPPVTAGRLQSSAQATVDWFVRNQRTGGTWLYLYDADDDSISPEYNEVRHAGVTMGLYQAAAAGLPGALRSADRGTEWALDRLLERDGWAALASQGRVTTGADCDPSVVDFCFAPSTGCAHSHRGQCFRADLQSCAKCLEVVPIAPRDLRSLP